MSGSEDRNLKKEDKKGEKKRRPDGAPIVNLTSMVDRTAERISFLKKKQEDLQKQKMELEELRRQREELDSGKREVLTNLERGIAVLDKEESELKRKHSLVALTRSEFDAIITEVRAIREDAWREEDLKGELARALAVVAKAKREYTAGRGKIDALSTGGPNQTGSSPLPGGPSAGTVPGGAGDLFRRGFFLSLPAALLAFLIAILVGLFFLVR